MTRKNRTARAIVRDRARTNRAAARLRRNGAASLTTHVLAQGLAPKAARTVASSLRRAAAKTGVTGTPGRTHAGRRMRNVTRYTPAQVATLAAVYRPRVPAYKLAATALRLAA